MGIGGSSLITLAAHDVEGIIPAEPWSYAVVWCALAVVLVLADLRRWCSPAPAAATSPADRLAVPTEAWSAR